MRFCAAALVVALIGCCVQGQVLEFTAGYCGACRQMDPVVQRLRQDGYEIRAIDVEAHPDVARQFQISSIPCFVAMDGNQVVDYVVGATSYDRLLQLCQSVDSGAEHANAAAATETIARGQSGRPLRGRLRDRISGLRNGQCACPAGACRCQCEVPVATPQASNPVSSALASSVRLKIEDATGHSFGTGTIIDVHDGEALVLTCGHIFRSSEGKGPIICDLFATEVPVQVEGKLICYDMRRDVGLVSLRPGVEVTPAKVGGTGQRPSEGDRVFSVGCNRGEDPTVMENQILAVNRYHGPANLVVGGKPVDGRSGGGLFTAAGVLIGVCNAADQEEDEGLYAALGPIHAELDRAGLGFIYRPSQPALARNTAAATPGQVAGAVPQALAPSSSTASAPPANRLDSVPASSRQPQPGAPPVPAQSTGAPFAGAPFDRSAAGFERSAATGTELICIVRSDDDAGENSRVFVIDGPSDDLVRQLSQEVNQRSPHQPTQMRSPHTARANWEGDWHSK